MVDPLVYYNPFKAVRHEPFPTTGRSVELGPCPKCNQKGVLLFYAPHHRAYRTTCIKCSAQHVIHPKGTTMADIMLAGGGKIAAGPRRNVGERSEHIDATKRIEELRRRRELGHDYHRNPS